LLYLPFSPELVFAMPCILLVDDDDSVRVAICAMLENAGHEVVVAVDGVDGLSQTERRAFDLVLCDVFMPRLGGIAMLQEFRRRDATTPVVMMSAGAPRATRIGLQENPDHLALSLTLGATETVTKPFKISQLTGLIDSVLRDSGSRRPH
jgi:DNA-binding response OmpR family regulator